jgi:hypothetical protein
MKKLVSIIGSVMLFLTCASTAFAATSSTITDYTNSTVQLLTAIAGIGVVFFLIKGGYLYITSSGKPEALESAKRTIKHALIGLVIVLAASVIVTTLTNSLSSSSTETTTGAIPMTTITQVKPDGGLTQVLLDAIQGVLKNMIQSAVTPLVTSVIGFLTNTPNLLTNQVITKFWLVMVGITDSLFVVVVAVLGLHIMSAETFGFEQVELKQLLPRIGLAFIGANSSLFLCDYAIVTCNALIKAVLDSTGGLNQAWILDAVNPVTIITQSVTFIVLLFLVLFLGLTMVLLFMFIARLIIISVGAVLSPFIFLLWTLPKFSDFAEISIKAYFVTVFSMFVNVVVIQLASSFLTIPGNTDNPLMSIAVGIGLFFVMLKIPSTLMQMVFYTSGIRSIFKIGGHILNALTASNSSSATRAETVSRENITPRKAVNA